MFEGGKYKNWSNGKIKADLETAGYKPLLIKEKPNDFLDSHLHKLSHILVVLEGEMKVKLRDRTVVMKVGDKITIDTNMEHAAYFGKSGCKYFWIEF